MTPAIIFLILLALLFDFLNGFHDSANAIATIVSTRVLSPRQAVLWAATFEFLSLALFFFIGLHVANTIGKIDPIPAPGPSRASTSRPTPPRSPRR